MKSRRSPPPFCASIGDWESGQSRTWYICSKRRAFASTPSRKIPIEVDAFALWHSKTPFVFLNTLKSAEHGRFDAAHELGHLVLHRHSGPHVPDAEKQANAFASAFLMPRASVLANRAPNGDFAQSRFNSRNNGSCLCRLCVSPHALGLLTDWHYRTLCIEIGQSGYRRTEPEGAQRERSHILATVFSALREEGVSKMAVAEQLQFDVDELDKLVFGLMILSLSGGARSVGIAKTTGKHLRLVK